MGLQVSHSDKHQARKHVTSNFPPTLETFQVRSGEEHDQAAALPTSYAKGELKLTTVLVIREEEFHKSNTRAKSHIARANPRKRNGCFCWHTWFKHGS